MTDASANPEPKRLPIVALLTANAISMVGNTLGIVAIPWFVLETTGSAARTGVIAFATVLPTVIAAILGGALVDRFGNKRISVIADLVSAVTVAAIPLLHETTGIEFWQLLVLVFIGALLDAPGNTARMALVPDLAAMGNVSLERANGASQAIQSASVFLGPPLAGILIAVFGTSEVLWLNAVSFIVSAAVVGWIIPTTKHTRETTQHYLQDVREGLSFIRGERFLISLLFVGGIANFAGAPLYAVVLPVFARETYGNATDLGLLLGGVGAGSLLGAVLFGTFGARLPRRPTALLLSFLSAAPIALLALNPPVWAAAAVLAIAGLGDGYVNPLVITVIYERVPAELRGRVLGSMIACILAAAPFGMLLAGWAVNPFGIDAVILAIAAVLLLVTALFALAPGLRDLGPSPAAGRTSDSTDPIAV